MNKERRKRISEAVERGEQMQENINALEEFISSMEDADSLEDM